MAATEQGSVCPPASHKNISELKMDGRSDKGRPYSFRLRSPIIQVPEDLDEEFDDRKLRPARE
jgi:hypothetical protein